MVEKVTIVIATVASFYFNITDINWNCKYPFKTLVPNFLNEGATKVNKNNGAFRFAGDTRCLNKKTQIWFDEAQDLAKEQYSRYSKINVIL